MTKDNILTLESYFDQKNEILTSKNCVKFFLSLMKTHNTIIYYESIIWFDQDQLVLRTDLQKFST